MQFFTSEKISPSTTSITDITGVHSFLIEGNNAAVLVDTGTGAGDIKAYVESCTKLPVSVILTHGHCDHAGGAAWFEKVYLHRNDWELVKVHATVDRKIEYVTFTQGGLPESVSEKDFCPDRTAEYLPLEDGQRFDLGGIVIEAVLVPGHTHGMTCILNHTERSILFGDACNPSVFLWDNEATTVEDYRDSLLKFKEREAEYDTVYLSHGPEIVDKKILDGVIQVCEDIMEGRSDEIPFPFMDYQGLMMAKETSDLGKRADGGLGNIIYNSQKIFKK